MKHGFVILILILVLNVGAKAQNFYWIGFTDKEGTEFSLEDPLQYLSERAIQRRQNQNIAIDSLDLPVSKAYVDSILTLNVELVHSSKWLNGITVKTKVDTVEIDFPDWSFIKEVQRTKPNLNVKSAHNKFEPESIAGDVAIDTSYYGASVEQVGMLNGQFLHNKGFRGKGMQIAVLDAGFYGVDELQAFDSLWAHNQILGTRDFVLPGSNIFKTDEHGMSVLSCMGGLVPGQLIGTAPDADYWLIRSEARSTEYIIEEDNWVVAAEFADSVGVDVINSSLGYTTFDDASTNHTYADMDGNTTRVTRGANIAVSRGILVVTSAGNERRNSWFRIAAPSDGDLVMGVGAVTSIGTTAGFSSAGPAYDGDVKPNVAAMGFRTVLQRSNNKISVGDGTSFASPVMAGMAASLWQMFPERTALEIKEAIEKSGHQYNSPDSLQGFGIPDMQIAAEFLGYLSVENIRAENIWHVYPNPVKDHLLIETSKPLSGDVNLEWISIDGTLIKKWSRGYSPTIEINNIEELSRGIYFLRISNGNQSETVKINKL